VSVRWSIATALGSAFGSLPTVRVGHGPLHRETSSAWQWRSSITETVLPPAFVGPLSLKPFVTYSVCVAGSTAAKSGPLPTGAEATRAEPNEPNATASNC